MINRKLYKSELDGEEITLEISDLVPRANAAVLGYHGETAVLATVVMGKGNVQSDYFPLTVDYEERFYAAGKIIGSRFIRREGRPSDEAVLSSRLIDRTIRPLFDERLRREVQVVVTVLAYDEKNDPDAIALLAASTALAISDIPWNGPVAGVKIQEKKETGELIHKSFFSGPENEINMIELEGNEISEDKTLEIMEKAQSSIKKLIAFQKEIIKEINRPKIEIDFKEADLKLKKIVSDFIASDLGKTVADKKTDELKDALAEHLKALGEESENIRLAMNIIEKEADAFLSNQIIEKEKRPDGRKLDEIRALYSEIGLFKRTHGSGLFARGETHILAVTTLASPSAEQLIETMESSGKKRFMLHYNFPNFSVGETGRSRGPGRREIGHGALAAKALTAVIPTKEEFPYTIRVVAETLSSNGSSSMASTCAASLSLMDAGVPIKKHVAGIAIGLVTNPKGEYKILTDIQGPEDQRGVMDLKIAGTRKGITAIQMDVKINGINKQIFKEALERAEKARFQILDVMEKTIPAPKSVISDYAPTILTLTIPPDRIGEVIGPGGKIINNIIANVGNQTTIDIEQTGQIFVSSVNKESAEKAIEIIKQIVREYQIGEIIYGKIIKILDFGAIIDLGGGQDGMIHVSELKDGYVKKVEDIVHLGDFVKAKIIRVEPGGKIALSLNGVSQS